DPAATDIRVTRMNPDDPANNGPWAGVEASVIAGAPNDQLRVRVWRPADLTGPVPIAIIEGSTAHPAQVISGAATLDLDFVAPPAAADYRVARPQTAFDIFVARGRRDGDAYVIEDFPPATGTPGNIVYAVTHGPSTPPVE